MKKILITGQNLTLCINKVLVNAVPVYIKD